MWIGIIFGGFLTAYLMAFRFKSAIIIGIAIVSIFSWPSVLHTRFFFAKLTFLLDAVQPLRIFLTRLMANHVSNSSSKSSHSTQFAILLLHKIGISQLPALTLHWRFSHSYMLISSIAQLHCIPWHAFREQLIQKPAISLDLQ